jgi:hypothetical protein
MGASRSEEIRRAASNSNPPTAPVRAIFSFQVHSPSIPAGADGPLVEAGWRIEVRVPDCLAYGSIPG